MSAMAFSSPAFGADISIPNSNSIILKKAG
jgi:hypothetical protein